MRKIFVAILGAILLPIAAAAQPAGKAPAKKAVPPPLDMRKKIGLITDIGSTFSVRKIGIMVFGNEEASVPIDGWTIDSFVTSKTATILKAHFNVIPIKLSKEGKAGLADAPGSLFGDRAAHICNVLRKEAPGQSFAYYLWIKPGLNRYRNTNQTLKGLGIIQGKDLITSNTFVHALFAIEAMDGQNCSHIRVEEPSAGNGPLFEAIRGPNRKVEDSWMPAAPSAAAQDTRLRDAVKELVEQGMAQALPRVFATEP
jgi:hypothetical protein